MKSTLDDNKYCVHCRNLIPIHASYCSGCGRTQEPLQYPPQYPIQAPSYYSPSQQYSVPQGPPAVSTNLYSSPEYPLRQAEYPPQAAVKRFPDLWKRKKVLFITGLIIAVLLVGSIVGYCLMNRTPGNPAKQSIWKFSGTVIEDHMIYDKPHFGVGPPSYVIEIWQDANSPENHSKHGEPTPGYIVSGDDQKMYYLGTLTTMEGIDYKILKGDWVKLEVSTHYFKVVGHIHY